MGRLLRLSFDHDCEAVAELGRFSLGFCGWKIETWVARTWLGGVLCPDSPFIPLLLWVGAALDVGHLRCFDWILHEHAIALIAIFACSLTPLITM